MVPTYKKEPGPDPILTSTVEPCHDFGTRSYSLQYIFSYFFNCGILERRTLIEKNRMKKDKNTCAVQYMFINKSNTNLVYNSNTDLIYKSDSDLVYKLNTDHICTNRIRILSTNRIWICMVYNWDPDLIYTSDKNLVCKFRNRLERVCNTSGNNIFRAYLIYFLRLRKNILTSTNHFKTMPTIYRYGTILVSHP